MSSVAAVGAAPAWVCAQASGEPTDMSECTFVTSGTLVEVVTPANFSASGCVGRFVRIVHWRAEAG